MSKYEECIQDLEKKIESLKQENETLQDVLESFGEAFFNRESHKNNPSEYYEKIVTQPQLGFLLKIDIDPQYLANLVESGCELCILKNYEGQERYVVRLVLFKANDLKQDTELLWQEPIYQQKLPRTGG